MFWNNKPIKTSYTFNDLLLIPQKSDISRDDISLVTRLSKQITLKIPLISAAMDTVTEANMAIAMARAGGLGIIHKNLTLAQQVLEIKKVKSFVLNEADLKMSALDNKQRLLCGIAVSTNLTNYANIVTTLVEEAEVDVIVIDSAHGNRPVIFKMISNIKQTYPSLTIIAGNIVDASAAKNLIKAGADCIKVGIGSGSICTTRGVTGVGVPQLSAIMDCYTVAKKYHIPIISDGGVRNSGDIVKALASGAHLVMIGSLIAGCDETPIIDQEIIKNNIHYRNYRGMGSLAAMLSFDGERYDQLQKDALVPEGVAGYVVSKGPLGKIINHFTGAIISGLWYTGAKNIISLHKKSQFTLQTKAGYEESNVAKEINVWNK